MTSRRLNEMSSPRGCFVMSLDALCRLLQIEASDEADGGWIVDYNLVTKSGAFRKRFGFFFLHSLNDGSHTFSEHFRARDTSSPSHLPVLHAFSLAVARRDASSRLNKNGSKK